MHLGILGPVVIDRGGARVALSPLLRRLLGILAAYHPVPVTQPELADTLYDGAASERGSLQSAVWRLRNHVGMAVVTNGNTYQLDVPREQLDLARFLRWSAEARAALVGGDPHRAARTSRAALDLWRGPLLADCGPIRNLPEPAAQAEHLRDEVAEDWAEAVSRAGRPGEAVGDLVRLVGAQPLRERAWALLIDAHRALGQAHDARVAADLAHQRLADAGLEPGPGLLEAVHRAAGARFQHVRRVAARQALPPSLRVVADSGPFVGRERELDEVVSAATSADAGSARLVILSAEAGAGKTRLAAEAASLAVGRGLDVWFARCDPSGAVPFSSLADTLAALIADVDPATAGALTAGPLAAVLPAQALSGGPTLTSPLVEEAGLFAAIGELFEVKTATQAAMLVVDDIQWACAPLLRLLVWILRARPGLRLCVVATCRSTEPPTGDAAELLAQLAGLRNARTLALAGLGPAEIAAHPDLPAGVDAGVGRLRFARQLHAVTNGNMLFLSELLRDADILERLQAGIPCRLPAGLRAAVDGHVAGLAPATRRVLTVAAIIGRRFSPALLRAVAAHPTAGTDPGLVDDALDAAEVAQVIVALRGRARFEFRHELVRDSLLGTLGALAQSRLHVAVAETMASGPGADRRKRVQRLSAHVDAGRLAGTEPGTLACLRLATGMTRPGVQVRLSGPLAVKAGGSAAEAAAFGSADAQVLVALLACARDRGIGVAELAATLWPAATQPDPRAARQLVEETFRTPAVARLRGFGLEAGSTGTVRLRQATQVVVDVEVATAAAGEAEAALAAGRPRAACVPALAASVVTSRPFLEGVDHPWADQQRVQLADLHLRAVLSLAEARLALGEVVASLEAATAAVGLDPQGEPGWTALIRAHAVGGSPAAAAQAYARFRESLARLGRHPSPAMVAGLGLAAT